jgi:hypothetical protein
MTRRPDTPIANDHGDAPMSWPQNRVAAGDLLDMTPGQIAALPVADLATLQTETEALTARARAIADRLAAGLAHRYGDHAAAMRRGLGKDSGVVRIEDDGFVVVADLPKRVTWDQAQLAALAARIRAAGDNPDDYVETTLKVSERRYAAWPAPIRAGFEPARTVTVGAPKFTIMPKETA